MGFLESRVEKEELAAVFWEICVCSKGLQFIWKTKMNTTRILDGVKTTDFRQIYFSLAVRLRPDPPDFISYS